jgi:hypothetical protein
MALAALVLVGFAVLLVGCGWCLCLTGVVMRTRLLAGTLLLLACSCGSPTTPSITNIAGTWAGPLTDNIAGPGTVTVTISQSGTALTGSWTITYQDVALNNALSMIGGNAVSYRGVSTDRSSRKF